MLPEVFQRGCTFFLSWKRGMGFPAASHSCYSLLLSVFKNLAILVES